MIEGWLDPEELPEAQELFSNSDYEYIITTGIKLSPFHKLSQNSWIRIYADSNSNGFESDTISIVAYGSPADNVNAEFELLINGKSAGIRTVTRTPNLYTFITIKDSIETIDVKFINDAVINGEDRNLFISKVKLNGQSWNVNDSNISFYLPSGRDTLLFSMAATQAERNRNRLIDLGIPPDKIIAINTLDVKQSRTFETSATTVEQLDQLFGRGSYSLNILSRYPHSRRTYAAYSKNLKDKKGVGIIVTEKRSLTPSSRLNNIREFLGILFIKLHFW